jgi:hypothetical protein
LSGLTLALSTVILKVMANSAQLINCLNSLYLAKEDKFSINSMGHASLRCMPHTKGAITAHDFLRAERQL